MVDEHIRSHYSALVQSLLKRPKLFFNYKKIEQFKK